MGKVCLETFRNNYPFRLTSLVYVENFGQRKEIIFLSFHDKSKQIYKVKINNIQGVILIR